MRKHTLAVGTLFIANLAAQVAVSAQGCSDLLRNGVYDTFNVRSYNRSSSEWHHALCSSTIQSSGGSNSGGLSIGVVLDGVPLKMSAAEADAFQKFYQNQFCTTGGAFTVDLSNYNEVKSNVDPSIVSAYVACHAVENAGLQTTVTENASKSVFTVAMRYSAPFATKGPTIQSVNFAPAVVTCTGSLANAMRSPQRLNESWQAMQCTRAVATADVSVLVATDVGAFTYEVAPEIPPPTATQLIMAALPRGTILGWYDATRVPDGWHICDGTNGTPNIIDRYVMGSSGMNLGKLVGSATHTHAASATISPVVWSAYNPDTRLAHDVGGGNYQSHVHSATVTIQPADNSPLGTQVMFIMKM